MTMQKKLVSIVISTHNNQKTIGGCLDSIKRQTYPKIEVIVVDEWSSDKTAKIAKDYNAKVYLHGKERANNRNFGMEKAKGEYYCIIDSDMELTPKVIEKCTEFCKIKNFDAIVIPERSVGEGFWANVRAFERQFTTGEKSSRDNTIEAARFFKKEVYEKIGGYDPSIVGAEDWDLHQRVLKNQFKVGRINSYIIHHEGRLTLGRLLKKKIYYGKAFLIYSRRYPKAFQKSIIRTSLLKNWYKLLRQPALGLGVFVLKFLEGISLLFGMVLAKFGRRYEHY